jgi:hypothetical protein
MNPPTTETTATHGGPDRLIDAMIREHARLGTGADEFLLARIDRELTKTKAPAPSGRALRVAGIAAAIILGAGLVWKMQVPDRRHSAAVETANGSGAGSIPLATDLPPELIEGTPKPMNVPNLVAVPTTAPTMRVPEGTVLLSRGCPVTSSDSNPIIGSLDLLTDGDKNAGEGYFVELMDGLQWVQIDLGKQAAIQAVWVWHFHSQRRAYHDVIIQISDDPEFKRGVTTVFNNDYDNSSGMGSGTDRPYVESRFGLLVDAKGAPGRHVRLYSAGNTSNEMNHYIEAEVFGIPRKGS